MYNRLWFKAETCLKSFIVIMITVGFEYCVLSISLHNHFIWVFFRGMMSKNSKEKKGRKVKKTNKQYKTKHFCLSEHIFLSLSLLILISSWTLRIIYRSTDARCRQLGTGNVWLSPNETQNGTPLDAEFLHLNSGNIHLPGFQKEEVVWSHTTMGVKFSRWNNMEIWLSIGHHIANSC